MSSRCRWLVALVVLGACLPASADRPQDLQIASVQAAPNPFSPNGDGNMDATQIGVALRLRMRGGLFAGDDGRGIDQRGTFILETTVQIGATRTLVDRQRVTPDVRQGDEDRPRYIDIPVQLTWDGKNSGGATVPDGVYQFQVTARFYKEKTTNNRVHQETRATAGPTNGSVTVSTAGPTVAIVSPAQNGSYAGSVPADVTYSANAVPATFRATLNGSPVALSAGPGRATGTLALRDGLNTFAVEVADAAGNRAQAQVTFSSDGRAPDLAILSPQDGLLSNAPTLDAIVTYVDGGSGVDTATFSATLNGSPIALTVAADRATGTITPSEGPNVLSVTIRDRVGNRSDAQVAFTIDRTRPSLAITLPTQGLLTNAVSIPAEALYSDIGGSGVDLSTFAATLNASPVGLAVGANRAAGTLLPAEGLNQVFAVQVSDRAGNRAMAQVMFGVDRTPPTIQVVEPANGFTVDVSIPTLRIRYSDAASGIDTGTFFASMDNGDISNRFSVSGTEAATISQPLADGDHFLFGRIRDRAGNEASASSGFRVETVPPPPPGPGQPGYIDGQIVDARSFQPLPGAEVRITGLSDVATSGNDGRFSYRVPGPGEFDVTVTRNGYHYSQRKVVVEENRDTGIGIVYLLAVDTVQVVSAASGGTVTDSSGDLVVEFPPNEWATDTEVHLTLIRNPRELPSPLPDNVAFVSFFFGEPSGPLAIPVRVKFRNCLGLPPGTQLPIGFWAKEDLRWQAGPMATVSQDGQWLEGMWSRFSSGGATASAKNQPCSTGTALGGPNGPSESTSFACRGSGETGNSFVGYHFGQLREDVTLVPTRRLEQDWGLTLTYDSSTTGAWSDLVGVDVANPTGVPLPEKVRFGFSVQGTYAEAWFTPPDDYRVTGRYLLPARNGRGLSLPTGAYPAQIEFESDRQLELATTSRFGGPPADGLGIQSPFPVAQRARFKHTLTIHRRDDSPFGAGWGLRGVESIHAAPDGTVALVEGSGARTFFKPGGIITTLAGSSTAGFSGDGGPAKDALLNYPVDVIADSSGNTYIADAGNNRIRRIDAVTGIIQTIAGGGNDFTSEGIPATEAQLGLESLSQFAASSVMSADGGTIYFADTSWNRIRRINPDGTITTVAGARSPGFSGDGGPALEAEFNTPTGVAFDAFGNLLVSDMGNNRLRMIDAAGMVSTIAGTGAAATAGDGLPAIFGSLNRPISVTVDIAGNIFMVENTMLIRKITTDGIISTLTGCTDSTGFSEDGQDAASSAYFGITDVQAGVDGALLFADRANGRIRMLDAQGALSTIAGTGARLSGAEFRGEGGPAREAQLSGPGGIAVAPSGDVYIADTFGNALRRVSNSDAGRRILTGQPWEFSTLLENPDGSYVRRFRSGGRTEYSPEGNITKRVDRNGNTVTYVYAGGLLVSVEIPTGERYTLTYDGAGHLTQISDPAGRATRFVVDASGNLTGVTMPDGSSRSFAYDAAHLMTSQTDEEFATTQYEYDRYGKVTRSITPHRDAQGFQETHRYTHGSTEGVINELAAGTGSESSPAPGVVPDNPTITTMRFRSTSTDGRGNTSTIYTAAPGFVVERDDPLLPVEYLNLNRRGLPETIISASGLQILTTYDAQGNPTSVRQQSSGFGPFDSSATYDPRFNTVASVTDALGRTTRMFYDSNGNMTGVEDAQGNSSGIAYNALGLPVQFTDAMGNVTRITYDAATGNAVGITDPLGRTTNFTRDRAGNVIGVEDALGRTTQMTVDAMNRLSNVTDSLGQSTDYTRNRRGQVLTVTNPRRYTTTYAYTPAGLPSSTTNPLGQSIRYAYDLARNLVEVVNARGQRIAMTYDERNFLVRKETPDNVTVYGYDRTRMLMNVGDSDSYLSFARDPMGRVTQETTGGAGLAQPQVSLVSEYDAVGHRTSLQYSNLQGADGGSLSYTWDSLNRLEALTGFDGGSFGFSYDSLSRRTELRRPNGVSTNYVWDAASQLRSLVHASPRDQLARFDYTYNAVGMRDSMTDMVVQPDASTIGGTHSYGQDALDRLVDVQHPASEASFNPNETFSYDAIGDRLSDRNNADGTYQYDAAGRITSDARFDYALDADGNLASRIERSTGLTTYFSHDAESRLVGVTLPSGVPVSYSYDPMGRRIQKNVGGVLRSYAYDGLSLFAEYDASAALVARYTHGPSVDEQLSMERSGETYLFQTDGMGSVVQLTSSLGNVVQSYTYDAFGRVARSAGSVTNPFLFTGRELDAETGLYCYRARYYDPLTGRFLEDDPLGLDGFRYVGNAPQMFSDPLGLFLGLGFDLTDLGPALKNEVVDTAKSTWRFWTSDAPTICRQACRGHNDVELGVPTEGSLAAQAYHAGGCELMRAEQVILFITLSATCVAGGGYLAGSGAFMGMTAGGESGAGGAALRTAIRYVVTAARMSRDAGTMTQIACQTSALVEMWQLLTPDEQRTLVNFASSFIR